MLRAGYIMFLISPRNVPAAIADMLRKTDCRHLMLSSDGPVQELAKKALEELDGVTLHTIPTFEQLFSANSSLDELGTEDSPAKYDPNSLAMILHSSGVSHMSKSWASRRSTHHTTRLPRFY